MINQLLQKRFLFKIDNCDGCKKTSFIYRLNSELKIDKRIIIIDCTLYNRYGIVTDQRILRFEKYFDSFPTLFIDGIKKEGANTILEYKSYVENILRETDSFIFQKMPEYLPTIKKYATYNKKCKRRKGRIFCKEDY